MAERKLKDWLKAYMEYTQFMEAPEMFHFWTGIGTIGGALRRKVYFDQRPAYFWTPNFYIVFVAPPGIATKSTTANVGAGLLREVPGIKFGPNALTWQSFVTEMAQATEGVALEDGLLAEQVPMSCLTFVASELGSLLDPQDHRMVECLIEFWDGHDGSWKKATKTQGRDEVPNPWVNIMACTTPDWLALNMPRRMIGGGLTSRMIFLYSESKSKYVAYPKNLARRSNTQQVIEKLRVELVHDLEIISLMKGEMVLSPEAEEFGEEWYVKHWKEYASQLPEKEVRGYMARKQGHMHKLAMALAASESSEMCLQRKHLESSVKILDSIESDFSKPFKAMFAKPELDNTDRLIRTIEARGKVRKKQIFYEFMDCFTTKEFDEAIQAGINAGRLELVAEPYDTLIKGVKK